MFTNATVEMDGVLARRDELERLHECMIGAADHPRRIRLVEDLLRARLTAGRTDPIASSAVAGIERTQGTVRIAELARQVGLSQSALECRFRRAVGVSPRKFAFIVRIQHVAKLRAAGHDFTTIAHAAGYSDQPHFNNDFKPATGMPPEAFFRGNCLDRVL